MSEQTDAAQTNERVSVIVERQLVLRAIDTLIACKQMIDRDHAPYVTANSVVAEMLIGELKKAAAANVAIEIGSMTTQKAKA